MRNLPPATGLGTPIGEGLEAAAAAAGENERDGALGQVETSGQIEGCHDVSLLAP